MVSTWLGAIIIGFFAGLLARFLTPSSSNPSGCILTTILGIAGASFFTWLGREIGLYGKNDSAGFLGAVLGAVLVLLIYRLISRRA